MTTTTRDGRSHAVAAAQALLVTFLWSTSWVLIKVGLDDLDLKPLSFAGLRYAAAALILLPLGVRAMRGTGVLRDPRLAGRVAVYGLLFVAVAQGAQFAALSVLPATAVNLVLASIPAVVALAAVAGGVERPSPIQGFGVALLLGGALLYFGPQSLPDAAVGGLAAAALCVGAAAAASLLGRSLARDAGSRLGGAIGITAASMAVGGAVLLVVGIVLEGWPVLDARAWLIVAWLAAINTAFAFTLWNHTLRTLTAVESSVLNNTMTIQIAVLAVVFLHERLGPAQVAGLVLAAAGAVVVQVAPVLLGRRRVTA